MATNGILINQSGKMTRKEMLNIMNNLTDDEIRNLLGENPKSAIGLEKVENKSTKEILTNPTLIGIATLNSQPNIWDNRDRIASLGYVDDAIEDKIRTFRSTEKEKTISSVYSIPVQSTKFSTINELKSNVDGSISYNGFQLIFNDGTKQNLTGGVYSISTSDISTNEEDIGKPQRLPGYILIEDSFSDARIGLGYLNIPTNANGTFDLEVTIDKDDAGKFFLRLDTAGNFISLKPIPVKSSRYNKTIIEMINWILDNMNQ